MLAEARAQKLHSRTFAQCVDAYLDQHSSTWRNDKHRRQWRSTLNIAVDAFGDLDVRVVDTTSTSDYPPTLSIGVWSKAMGVAVNVATNRIYAVTQDARGPIDDIE